MSFPIYCIMGLRAGRVKGTLAIAGKAVGVAERTTEKIMPAAVKPAALDGG